jgi:hypothetical protein
MVVMVVVVVWGGRMRLCMRLVLWADAVEAFCK